MLAIDRRNRDCLGVSRVAVVGAAVATAGAGLVHAALIGEHVAEGLIFGLAFVVMAGYQIALAGLLVARPSARAYRAGIWGSALIVAVYLTTRVVPPPTATTPEEVTPLGIMATSLELAALVLLVTVLPDTEGRRWPIPAWVGGLVIGLATPVLWIFVTGAFQWAGPVAYRVPNLSIDTSSQGTLTPALYGWVTDRLYLFLPRWAALGALGLGVLAGANVWLATRLRRAGTISARRRRASLLGLLPAAFAAPVCCGVPLAALFGISTATLFAGAPFATAAAIGLLTWNVVTLDRIRRAGAGCECPPEPTDDGLRVVVDSRLDQHVSWTYTRVRIRQEQFHVATEPITYIDLGVGGMTCDDCVIKVTEALASVPGVRHATVDLEGRSAVVEAKPDVASETLTGAVRATGYNAFERRRRPA